MLKINVKNANFFWRVVCAPTNIYFPKFSANMPLFKFL